MRPVSNKLFTSVRILLGLVYLVFGLNGFFHFLPQPAVPGRAGDFLGALAATGYMFPLIKGTEVLGGLALLSNRFVPLALAALAPVTVNIFAFHALLAPGGMVLPFALVAAELYLAYAYRNAFRGMFAVRAEPARSGAELLGREAGAAA